MYDSATLETLMFVRANFFRRNSISFWMVAAGHWMSTSETDGDIRPPATATDKWRALLIGRCIRQAFLMSISVVLTQPGCLFYFFYTYEINRQTWNKSTFRLISSLVDIDVYKTIISGIKFHGSWTIRPLSQFQYIMIGIYISYKLSHFTVGLFREKNKKWIMSWNGWSQSNYPSL